MFEFLTFGLNFSRFLRGHVNFSLLVWISHFSCVNMRLTSMFEFLTFGHFSSEILTFPAGPVPRRPAHSHASRPFSCRRPALYHAGPPNDMVNTMSYHMSLGGPARAGRSPLDSIPGCEKWEIQSEKWEICASAQEKWEIQTWNWEIRPSTQENWEIQTKNEKFARLRRKSEKFGELKYFFK